MSVVQEFREGGRALLGSMIGAGCGLSSISFYTHGVFAVAVSSDTGWSRGDVQLGVTIMILMAIVTAPIAGLLVDRFGARRVALVSMPLYGLTLASLSLTGDHLGLYYTGWAVMSVLGAGTLPVTWTRVVTGWFDQNRGVALGITLAGTGVAATLGPSYVTSLIGAYGWRAAYLLLAGTILLISIPALTLLFREKQADSASVARKSSEAVPMVMGYRFWVIGIALVLAAAGIAGLITNSVSLLTDRGLTIADAARYAGLIGISVVVGRLVVGVLLDRIWAPLVAAVFLAAPAIAALILSGASVSTLYLSAAMIITGLAAGAELDLLAYLVSRYFGLRRYGTYYGALYIFFSIGAGLAPVSFGLVYDYFGSYTPILNIVAGMSVLGAALMLTLGKYPDLNDD
ncbi:MAG: MFS transporter [Gammaproteobacteria bacterium]|nr:MFS transporter [Gammaproteobacteria bacterium]